MGDRSPKSRNKNDKQKQVKSDVIAGEKQRVVDSDAARRVAAASKKK